MKKLWLHIINLAILWQVAFFSIFCISLEYNRDFIADNYCINRFDDASMCVGSCYITEVTTSTFENEDHSNAQFPISDVELLPQSLFLTPISTILDHPAVDQFSKLNATSIAFNSQLLTFDIFHPPQFLG